MATRRYGLSRGETEYQVLESVGAATVSDSLEMTVDLAANFSRAEVLQALRMIENWILTKNWPPA